MKHQPRASKKPAPEVTGAKAVPAADAASAMPAKVLIELGPLLFFFATNTAAGVYYSTAAFIRRWQHSPLRGCAYLKVPVMPLVTGVVVLVFGGLTLYLRDDTFIKLKPTIVYLQFALALAVGLLLRKRLFEVLLGAAFSLREEGWRKLAWRWTMFFIAMALVNELVPSRLTFG
jgi:intracellular septation protein